jgi:hypothetical protein
MTRHVQLVDDKNYIWVSADLTPTRIRSLIRAYAKCGIQLTERGE